MLSKVWFLWDSTCQLSCFKVLWYWSVRILFSVPPAFWNVLVFVTLLLDLLQWSQKPQAAQATLLNAAPEELGLRSPHPISGGVGVSGFISEAPGSFKLLEVSSLCIASAQAPCFSSSRNKALWNCLLPVWDAFKLSNSSLISLFFLCSRGWVYYLFNATWLLLVCIYAFCLLKAPAVGWPLGDIKHSSQAHTVLQIE